MASSEVSDASTGRDQVVVSVLPVDIASGKVTREVADEWLDFVAACFAAKGTPRIYFKRQLENDPFAHTIIVARSGTTGKILSTLRIFHRLMTVVDGSGSGSSAKSVDVAAIGSVCTDPMYRGRGLSSMVLEHAKQMVASQAFGHFRISLLHARENFRNFYRSRGWRSHLHVPYMKKRVHPRFSDQVRRANLLGGARDCEGKDLKALMDIYLEYSGSVTGCEVRSPDYWRTWVAKSGSSFWVYTGEDGTILLYAAVDCCVPSNRGQCGQCVWRCREFGARNCIMCTSPEQENMLLDLMSHAIKDLMEECGDVPSSSCESSDTINSVQITIPAGSRLFQQDHAPKEDQFYDDGWLLYTVNSSEYQISSNNIVRWQTDNF